MLVHKFAFADASLERSPGQDGDIFTGNALDQRHSGPVTIRSLEDDVVTAYVTYPHWQQPND